VPDPIADFLVLPIKDHFTDASEVVNIVTIKFDLDADGRQDRFVGHSQLWWGDNTGLYCAAYRSLNKGFARLTPPDSDVRIDEQFFGPRSTTFCGYIAEKKTEGLLVLENNAIIRNADDPGLPPRKFARRKVYFIKNSRLMVNDLGPLDRTVPEGKAFYDRYFGKGVKSRPIKFEDYPVEKLKQLGYTIPDWKRPPPSK
jgi:hypothetical protein